MVAIDPRNGYIRAMASSSNYRHKQFNLAAQGHRQPGSAFKTFVLTTAIKRGINPNSTGYVSQPLDLNTKDYGPWKVQTYDQTYGGCMNLVRATLRSDNTVYAQLDLDLGPKSVADTAKEMGITTKLDGYPAEGLGGLTRGVSPLEMANAYATLASGGIRNKPIAITKVMFPDGEVEDLGKPKRERVLSDAVAYEVTKILKMNVRAGHRHARQHRLPRGRQDRHHRQLQRRLVRRLHAAPLGRRLGRLPGRAAGDAQRPRHLGRGRNLPGARSGTSSCRSQRATSATTSRPRRAPITWSPFFGKYSGYNRSYSYDQGGYGDSYGGGYNGYDPRLYGGGGGTPSDGRNRRRGHRRRRRRHRRRHRRRGRSPLARPRAPHRARRGRGARRAARSSTSALAVPFAAAGSRGRARHRRRVARLAARAPAAGSAGRSRTRARPGRSSTSACGWRWSRTSPCCCMARSIGPRLAVGAIAVAHVLFLLAPPLLSQDVFSYISYARLEVVHDLNPYTTAPTPCRATPPSAFAGSKDATSVYGPLFTLGTLPLAKLGVPGAFWTLKAVIAAASLGIVALTWACARRLGARPGVRALAVGLNPLVLVHVVGGAHNDALVMLLVMGAVLVGAVSAIRERRAHWRRPAPRQGLRRGHGAVHADRRPRSPAFLLGALAAIVAVAAAARWPPSAGRRSTRSS